MNQKLKIFFLEANNTKFWKKQFEIFSINLEADNFIDELSKLPILTKDQVKKYYKEIVNKKYISKSKNYNTSGTTGSGLLIPTTDFSETYTWLYWWYYRKQHGLKFNQRCAVFAGMPFFDMKKKKPPFWMFNIFTNQLRVSTQHMNFNNILIISEEIKKKEIKWLHGNPSAITNFAHLCSLAKIDMDTIKIISFGAESLLAHQKRIIKNSFKNSKIIEHYGLTEGVANIHQSIKNELIVDECYSYMELELHYKNTYKILGTNHHNFVFPLFRYQTDDIVTFSGDNEVLPRKIENIDGRKESYVYLKNGVRLGRLDFIFKDMYNVKEAQIIQRRDFSLDIDIVKNMKFNDQDEKKLVNEIENKIGQNINYRINYKDEIEKTKNGKLRFVISEIKNDL